MKKEEEKKKFDDLTSRFWKVGHEIRTMLKEIIEERGTIVFDYPIRLVILDDVYEEYEEKCFSKIEFGDYGDIKYAMYTDDDEVYSVDDMRDSFCVDLLENIINEL